MTTKLNRLRTKLLKADRAFHDALAGSRDAVSLPRGFSQDDWERLCADRASAENAFSAAVWDQAKAQRDRFKNRKRLPTYVDGQRLREAMVKAAAKFDVLCELGPDLYTCDEWHELRAAAWLAAEKFEVAQERYQDDERQAAADARAGIVRVEDRHTVRHL